MTKLETFEKFWELYDYKKAKAKAKKAFLKVDTRQYPNIFEHVKVFVKYTFKNGGYPSRPYPATYLNQERWHDEHDQDVTEDKWLDELRSRYGR